MKKKNVIFSLSILLFSLTSCYGSYEEIAPSIDELSGWDDNYIYYGNIKSKTTGEDQRYLIEQISYNNQIYSIESLEDFTYVNNDIYMVFLTKNEFDESYLFFIKYYTLLDDYSVIFTNTSYYYNSMEVIDNRYIYLRLSSYYDNYLIQYDTIKDEIYTLLLYDGISSYYLLKDVLIIHKDNKAYYSYHDEINFTLIEQIELQNNTYCQKNINGIEHIQIITNYYNGITNFSSIAYYNLKTDRYYELVSKKDKQDFYFINDKFLILGEYETYKYYSSGRDDKTYKHIESERTLLTNNKLYEIDFNSYNKNLVYTFKNEDGQYINGFIKDNKYIVNEIKIYKGHKYFKEGGSKYQYYQLDLSSLKFKKINYELENKEMDDNKLTYGKYSYYIKQQRFGALLSRSTAYFLYRVDNETNQESIIQFFASEYGELIGIRYSSFMWEEYLYEEYNINLNSGDFMILSY